MTEKSNDNILSHADRLALQGILRQRKTNALTVRRANALLLLDDGWKFDQVAKALYLDQMTIASWRNTYAKQGLKAIDLKDYKLRVGKLSKVQETSLIGLLRADPPRSTAAVLSMIAKEFGISYSRSGVIALLGRLGFSYKRPKLIPACASVAKQAAHISDYNQLLNGLEADEAVVFVDAVHPEHQSRPAFGWFYSGEKVALLSNTKRKRLNIHGAFNLEDNCFTYVEEKQINAETSLKLFQKLEQKYPEKRCIHLFLDNARYHHAKLLRPWLERPDCRVKLHFLPAYAPHLNPIERLWGVMHRHVTHNHYYHDFKSFTSAILKFFDETLPKNAQNWTETITDNFRLISQDQYKLIQ